MLRIAQEKRTCSAIGREVVVEFQVVEIGGKAVGPQAVIGCNSKHICKLLYEDEKIALKLNWRKCVFNK